MYTNTPTAATTTTSIHDTAIASAVSAETVAVPLASFWGVFPEEEGVAVGFGPGLVVGVVDSVPMSSTSTTILTFNVSPRRRPRVVTIVVSVPFAWPSRIVGRDPFKVSVTSMRTSPVTVVGWSTSGSLPLRSPLTVPSGRPVANDSSVPDSNHVTSDVFGVEVKPEIDQTNEFA
jgi:hypothetical protein